MSRPRTVDPMEVVAAVKRLKRQSTVARQFGITRVRVNQILEEYAPDLRKHPKPTVPKTRTPDQEKARLQERRDLLKLLNAHNTRKQAADALGLTTSGLYSRMRRLGIEY